MQGAFNKEGPSLGIDSSTTHTHPPGHPLAWLESGEPWAVSEPLSEVSAGPAAGQEHRSASTLRSAVVTNLSWDDFVVTEQRIMI